MTHPTDTLRLVAIDMQIESILHDLVEEVSAAQRGARVKARARQCCARGAAKNALLNLLAAAPASPLPGGGWQDISTAPKDGTRIIGLLKSGRAVTIVSKKHHNGWIKTEGGGYVPNGILDDVWSEEEAGAFVPRNPTHWMPLPAAPTGDA